MNQKNEHANFLPQLVTSGRIVLSSLFICSLVYTLFILGIAQMATPDTANGSLIHNAQGEIVGSKALAQGFSRPEYFWPRPSAVDYNATATGGSNLSPTNPKLTDRAQTIIARMGVGGQHIPADLVTASGSGMDPHITLHAAQYQLERVATARNISPATLMSLIKRHTEHTGGIFTPEPVINVLQINMALDTMVGQ
jgi:K+-transporting ATPase ATPase C chain